MLPLAKEEPLNVNGSKRCIRRVLLRADYRDEDLFDMHVDFRDLLIGVDERYDHVIGHVINRSIVGRHAMCEGSLEIKA